MEWNWLEGRGIRQYSVVTHRGSAHRGLGRTRSGVHQQRGGYRPQCGNRQWQSLVSDVDWSDRHTLSNAAYVSKNYNTSETRGGRAALKLDLGDNWTVTPTFMGSRSLPTDSLPTIRQSDRWTSCTPP